MQLHIHVTQLRLRWCQLAKLEAPHLMNTLRTMLAQHEQEHLAERRADDRVDELVERDDVDRQPVAHDQRPEPERSTCMYLQCKLWTAEATYVRSASRLV